MDIFIVFLNTNILLSRSIQRFIDYPYRHTSLAFDAGLQEVYSFGRKRPANPFIGGFVKEDFTDPFFQQAECEIYSCPVSNEQSRKMRQLIQAIESAQHLYGYNFLGLFGVLFQKQFHRQNRFFCVQFVAKVLKAGGLSPTAKPSCLLKPEELAGAPGLRLVQQGTLAAYSHIASFPSPLSAVPDSSHLPESV
ncbi:hypothetical protein [Planococcus lenghuensis]|uniref:Uncharacterized protein n=1 Tax=Planococcus lenghuensis TaxID=2213202 RepID=A0A1Q2KUG4_9BACL|nr:hypothetical protein [Planococcus lenghuensis]AQQ51850.1 hypothetical protein B0X71_01095 [Planococcus lenghuensis]